MAIQGPSEAELQSFLEQLGEVRRGMTSANQRLLDAMVSAATGRAIRAETGGDVSAYWAQGTPDTAIGVTDWATSIWGNYYWQDRA